MEKDNKQLFEYDEKNRILLDYIYSYEQIYGGYIFEKNSNANSDDLKLYNSNSDYKKEFDILSNNKELRFLMYAFPHDALIKKVSLKDYIFDMNLDLSSSFSKPIIDSKRTDSIKLSFKLIDNSLIDNYLNLIGKETIRYLVKIIDSSKFYFALSATENNKANELIIDFYFEFITICC